MTVFHQKEVNRQDKVKYFFTFIRLIITRIYLLYALIECVTLNKNDMVMFSSSV